MTRLEFHLAKNHVEDIKGFRRLLLMNAGPIKQFEVLTEKSHWMKCPPFLTRLPETAENISSELDRVQKILEAKYMERL